MSVYKNPIPTIDDEHVEEVKESVGGSYEYKKTMYFVFIDVLGFKQAFDEYRNRKEVMDEEDTPQFADKYKDLFIYYFDLINASNVISQMDKTGCYAGQTSDSLYFYSPRQDYLVEYIKLFLHFNLYAMSQNIFFRGGIAKGNLSIKEPYQFYGASVIHAYLLENSIACYPTVVIDENTYQVIKNEKGIKGLIKTNEKTGRHYLNIFAPLDEEFSIELADKMFEMHQIDMDQVMRNIQKNREKFEYDAKTYDKYGYLLNEYQEYLKSKNTKEKNEQ